MGLDLKRQTGRTTRLLKEAIRLLIAGRQVCVVASSREEASRFRRVFREELGAVGESVVVKALREVRYFNWHAMNFPGLPSDVEVLIDHHAIELEFGALLEMWERFDESRVLEEEAESPLDRRRGGGGR